ncbi:MAG: hypothetical protein M3322_01185 [Actinomycetota bacterium]|nr:hypothetical protein [Actinomycetota bacterium]
MPDLSTHPRARLARRTAAGMDVTLVWGRGDHENKATVCVRDRREGVYFEIPAEPYLALDVYYHPFAYRDFSTVELPSPDRATGCRGGGAPIRRRSERHRRPGRIDDLRRRASWTGCSRRRDADSALHRMCHPPRRLLQATRKRCHSVDAPAG